MMQRARQVDRSASAIFMRRCVITRPIHRLPKMLNRPITASDQALTAGGSSQLATTPGRCVAMKATWKPQVKKPRFSSR